MNQPISRHFATIDGRWGPRQVHYRRSGQGPALVLLHQSPQSSRELAALMQRWSVHFTLIAPDTPGYGQSDPLGPASLGIADFAEALGEFVDAIGLRRFGIYGFHTGASIGLWYAAHQPARVTAMAANGLAQLNDAERRDILANYLPPVVPAWDGSHLAWMWGRMREQTLFFPWYDRRPAARMTFDVPPAAVLHDSFMDFLRAGDHYAVAYRAAFESRPDTVLPGLRVPLLVTAAAGDPLQAHLGRLGELPPGVEVAPSAGREPAIERCLGHLLARRGDPAPAPVATRALPGRLWNRMLQLPSGQIRVRERLDGQGEPVMILHGAGQSADAMNRLAEGIAGTRPLIVADLPGHGESDRPATGPGIASAAVACLEVLGEAGLTSCTLAGIGAGACVALEMGRRSRARAHPLALLDLPFLPDSSAAAFREQGLPDLAPRWHGGHLLEAWHMLRDARLFFPWFDRRQASALRLESVLDESGLQAELLDLLRASPSWQSLFADTLDYPVTAALATQRGALAIGAASNSAWLGATRDAAASRSGLAAQLLPGAQEQWLPALLALFT